MIRKMQKEDINKVADIWLKTDLEAHRFIPAQYWESQFDMVKEMIAQAEVYVYENEGKIQGFTGLDGEYIAGIFVSSEMQSQGVGKLLLNFIKDRKAKLCLNVYQKNTGAIRFYQRERFIIQNEGLDENTGEKEYEMRWEKLS